MTPAGYSMERSAFEIVTINYRRQRAARPAVRDSEVVLRTAIGAGVEPTQNVENLRVRLRAPEAGLRLPADRTTHQWQHMDGDVVVALVPSLDSLNPGQLSEFALQPWLEDAPHLGLADSTIGNRARSVAGEDPDPRARVARLVRWVSENIRRVADPVVPRAATVLRERQADVDGHTLLFVALARSIGLPARPVSGILLAGDRFYLHSWAEVYVGGWIPVEPTWGEFPATANRIRLSSGTLARATDLLPQLAGLDVELLTLTQRP
jgi:hypothetical protein